MSRIVVNFQRCGVTYLDATRRYFAEWVDTDPSVFSEQAVLPVCSPKRDVRQVGYSRPFHLYCVVIGDTVVISFSKRLEDRISRIVEAFRSHTELRQVMDTLNSILPVNIGHGFKFAYNALPRDLDTSQAIQLKRDDFQHYKRFFETQHPGLSTEGLKEYFVSVVDRHYSCGVFQDNRLVSATDAPDIPYMSDLIVEPGINTLQGYRRCGYGRIAAGAMVEYLLKNGKVPIWSCGAGNQASSRLAESIGYVKFADVLSLSMDEHGVEC